MWIDVKSCSAGLWRLDLVKVEQIVFAEQAVPAMNRIMRELRTRLFSVYHELRRFRESVKRCFKYFVSCFASVFIIRK